MIPIAEAVICPPKTMTQFMNLSPKDLPLCGNGILDEGEVCDDGNRLGGDGCNGWCSAFDRMTKACTLAGQNKECSRGTSVASSPSQSSFCSLSSIAIAPNGKYLVVADGTSLIRMDLFTDSVLDNLYILPASGSVDFGKFCSIFIVRGSASSIIGSGDDTSTAQVVEEDIIIAHDCEKQNIVVFIYEGSTYLIKTPLPLQSHSTTAMMKTNRNKGYLDQDNNQLVIAGLPQVSDGLQCVELYGVNLQTYHVTLLGTIDCVAFNVIENGKRYPSFSMDGMVPYRVLRESCPFQMNTPHCYVVYMERNDMQLAKAYISVDGGTDTEYTVSTDETLNVLGAPLITRSEKSKITYTLTGNCFSASNTILSTMKMMPPVFALGYSCGPLPFASGKCSTPLNNPFITDIVSSSYLLPSGLSSTHEHQELLEIFMKGNASGLLTASQDANMLILGGLPLYRQILDNTHKGNVPIDFVEMPHTQDVIYITETTIGMINSKGMMLMDLYNPGYCRPIDAILCPTGYFGSVGGVCQSCDENQDTVSAQIQCTGNLLNTRRRRNLLSIFQSAPYTQISMVVSNKVQKKDIDTLMKFYMLVHGLNCTDASAMSGYQPYNMAADIQDAGNNMATNGKCTQLIPCIIESAGNNVKKNLSLAVPEEYMISWTLQNSSLVNALTKLQTVSGKSMVVDKRQAEICGLSSDTVDTLIKSKCMTWINSDFHIDWLPCALSVLNQTSMITSVVTSSNGRRRHLLQADTVANNPDFTMLAVPHSQGTFVSSTTVSWGVLSKTQSSSSKDNGNTNTNQNINNNEKDSNMFMIVIVSGVIGGLLITILIVGIFYMYFIKRGTAHVVGRTSTSFPGKDNNIISLRHQNIGYLPLNTLDTKYN